MKRIQQLGLAFGLLALVACDDNDSDPAPLDTDITISGIVELEDGSPAAGSSVTLLDVNKNVLGTASTASDGSYSFTVDRERYFQVNAQVLFSGGAEATGSAQIDTNAPSEGQAQVITLPDFDQHQLTIIGDPANGGPAQEYRGTEQGLPIAFVGNGTANGVAGLPYGRHTAQK